MSWRFIMLAVRSVGPGAGRNELVTVSYAEILPVAIALFQTIRRGTDQLSGNPLPQANAYAMIQRQPTRQVFVLQCAITPSGPLGSLPI